MKHKNHNHLQGNLEEKSRRTTGLRIFKWRMWGKSLRLQEVHQRVKESRSSTLKKRRLEGG